MADYREVGTLDQIPPGARMVVSVADNTVAIFNVDGTLYAIDDSCAHQGSSLAAGKLDGTILTCRSHGWRYDIRTGHLTAVPGSGVASYSVKIVDEKVFVAVS